MTRKTTISIHTSQDNLERLCTILRNRVSRRQPQAEREEENGNLLPFVPALNDFINSIETVVRENSKDIVKLEHTVSEEYQPYLRDEFVDIYTSLVPQNADEAVTTDIHSAVELLLSAVKQHPDVD